MLLGKYDSVFGHLMLTGSADNHENEEFIKGERTENLAAYLDRLYTAKRKVEKRIIVLGGTDDSVSYPSFPNLTSSYLSIS